MIEGVRDYFNVMLGPQLLYKIEKKQYAEVNKYLISAFTICLMNLSSFKVFFFFFNTQLVKSHPNVSMSGLYGVIHLLRLFGLYFNLL